MSRDQGTSQSRVNDRVHGRQGLKLNRGHLRGDRPNQTADDAEKDNAVWHNKPKRKEEGDMSHKGLDNWIDQSVGGIFVAEDLGQK